MKRIGFIDARRIRLPDKISIQDWGAILSEGYYLYFNDDYSVSIASLATGQLDFSLATRANFRIAGAIRFTITNVGFNSAYLGTLTGLIDISGGGLRFPNKADPHTYPLEEGRVWYNTTLNKLEFAVGAGNIERVTSVAA